ncbi:hypothetical protein [Streptomyces sp. NPDC021139]|uniref:hypothetical protein n=1 Tax=unclassified Streptomyces TaxID=2593676 RepID=UPI0033E58295
MDQGRAAVYGAAIGVLGTLLGSCITWLQLRTQAKASNSQWRRQVQRDSYGVLLERVDSLRKAFEPIERRALASTSTAADSAALEVARDALLPEVDAAIIVVLLEGPATIAERAILLSHTIRAWGEVLEALVGTVLADDPEAEAGKDAVRSVSQEAGEAVGGFLLSARKHLDKA